MKNENNTEKVNAPPKIVVKQGFGFGSLVFVLILGLLAGSVLTCKYRDTMDSFIKKGSEKIGVLFGQIQGKKDNPQPVVVTKRVNKAEIIAALRTIRAYVGPIRGEIEILETERNRELLMHNILINQEGKSEDFIDCRRLKDRADKIQTEIDARKSETGDYINVETELKLVLDEMVTEGYESTRDPRASEVLENAKMLAIKAGFEQELKRQLEQGSMIPDEEWEKESRTLRLAED